MTEWLDRENDPDGAAKVIATNMALREEARASLPALGALAQHRAGEDGVRRVVARRFATFPQPERSEEEWAAWWADYVDALADLPLACLEAAMRAFVASPSAEFMPKPGKLRELAEITPSLTLRRYQRARRAVMLADGQGAAIDTARPEPSEAEVVAIRKMAAEAAAAMSAKSAVKLRPALPNTGGKPDEGGLSPLMRAHLARQAGHGEELA